MDETLEHLTKVIRPKDFDKLKNIIIYQEENGSYNLYGKYVVVKNLDGSYKTQVLSTFTEHIFHKLSNAIAWCNFDKRNLYFQAMRIIDLDKKLYSLDAEIQIQSKLLKKSKDSDAALIYLCKLSNSKAKKRMFSLEINKFVNEAKNWQTKEFDKSKLLSQER